MLQGRIARGVADRIKAVLWFSDLRSYTRISDSADPEQIIPLLNDYADAIVTAIHQHSGDVLKLIGDGVLAIFPAQDRARACAEALEAAREAREAVAALNARRAAEGLPVTDMYLGLHLGVVFYGNIGSKERLDFTVVGPAVNEVARIAAMCRSVDQPILISSAFADVGRRGQAALRLRRTLCAARRGQAAGTVHARHRSVVAALPSLAERGRRHPPWPYILWIQGFRSHTIFGREINFFRPLRRHFRSARNGCRDRPSCRPSSARSPAGRRQQRV